MLILAMLGTMALVAVYVMQPLFQQRGKIGVSRAHRDLDELTTERERLYQIIQELEFDHQAGHLADGDYQELRESYEREAALVLAAMDRNRTQARRKGRSICPNCASKVRPKARFCHQCGTNLMRVKN